VLGAKNMITAEAPHSVRRHPPLRQAQGGPARSRTPLGVMNRDAGGVRPTSRAAAVSIAIRPVSVPTYCAAGSWPQWAHRGEFIQAW